MALNQFNDLKFTTNEEDVETKIPEEIEKENEELRAQVIELKKILYASNKSETNLKKRLVEMEEQVRILRSQKKDASKKTSSLDNSLRKARKSAEVNKKRIEKIEDENYSYKSQLQELEKLRSEVEEYRQRENGFKTFHKSDGVRNKVKRAMISLLMEHPITFDCIEMELAKRGLLMDRYDLFSVFKEINQEYSVKADNNSQFASPCYSIESPIVKSYLTTSINYRPGDIILTSDWHAYELDDFQLFKRIDLLLEYCTQYNIPIMVNLGDFFDYRLNGSLSRAQNSIDAQQRLETLAQKIPYQKDITHYVMGANHDEKLRRYRLDTLKILENIRPDIISLGFNHAILDINGTPFGLHHPESEFKSLKDYKTGLNNWSQKKIFNYEDMYMNLFGHFHEYKLFKEHGILSCPSLARDFHQNGAIHMRLHYDSKGHISSVEIIPLNISNSINRWKPQIYQKKLKNSNK